ncbi:hypothetical protein [Deinococcus soli (ex Cha et al. 2016)]|uniref:Uncharacterized protein n=2 Tax=Deinococcus soli (ex Cha et al. 2016) TaxID=1309411 RepID=A0AAE4BN12_9DEIO|nr:hypothetical protein [Deinococcus soli (ex Cha et al. 2016)]MDR6219022.1 hypothetical protein [Deinococcus soli (ex Cha et al. 2016)]MDR6328819.1 hypothetical protein [Deinococcus soli (ex Cha et al. 2016)]MDR6751693.1 hypothetical protein [Deinococcus soli (ex Cha et al. 2016)]
MPRGKQVALLSALKLQASCYRERRDTLIDDLLSEGAYQPERWSDVQATELLIATTDGAIALLGALLTEQSPKDLLREPRARAWLDKQEQSWQQRSWARLRERLVPDGHTLRGMDQPASAAD